MSVDLASEPISETERQKYCVEIMQRLNIQRRNEHLCDVILEVGSGDDQVRLKAHRNVLCASSPFFYNALNTEMKEKKEGVIRLEDTSKALMEEVLEFLYTGHVELSDKNALNLLAMADYLIIPSLKEFSSKFIIRTMSASNCIMIYYSAVKYQCTELQTRARDYIFANFMSVTTSDEFFELSKEQVEEWISRDEIKVKSEEEVFQVIVKWMERRENEEHEEFFQLLRHVRLMYLTRSYVFSNVLPHPLVKNSETCRAFVLDTTKEIVNGSEECFFAQPARSCLKKYEDGLVTCGEDKTFCFLPSENKWYEMCVNLSKKTLGCCTSAVHSKLYVPGEGGKFEQYDPSLNSWALLKCNSDVNAYILRALINYQGSLFVIGEASHEDGFVNSVYKYSPDTNLWQELAPMSVARACVCAVADESSLYAIGGSSRNGLLDVVEKYDPEKNSWRRVASISERKMLTCGVIVNSKVFLFGGVKSSTPSTTSRLTEIYDPASDVWTSIQNIPSSTFLYGALSFKGDVFVTGFWEGVTHSFKVYNHDKNEWKPCAKAPAGVQMFSLAPLRIPRDILSSCKVVF